MRTMMKITVPVETGNATIKDGSLPLVLQTVFGQVKPEAAYFFTEHGKRTAMVVFDMNDPSQIPAIAEPLFMSLNAEVQFTPVMNQDDLQKGIQAASQQF